MKRLHVNVAVEDLAVSIRFYSTLFAVPPSVQKADYAKWMLEDPRVNFAITTRGEKKGIDHLGIQVENESELAEVYGRLQEAEAPVMKQGETTCCYARSSKSWINDPEGISWETFLTHGESTVYGEDRPRAPAAKAACCAPAAPQPAPAKAGACCGTAKA